VCVGRRRKDWALTGGTEKPDETNTVKTRIIAKNNAATNSERGDLALSGRFLPTITREGDFILS
jgi:hypothetical protein